MSAIDDDVWQRVRQRSGRGTPVPAVLAVLTLTVLLAALGWRAGFFGPQLSATVLRVSEDPATADIDVELRLANVGLFAGLPSSAMNLAGTEVRGVEPHAHWSQAAPVEERLAPGASRTLTLRLPPPCGSDPDRTWVLRMVGYGPTGGTEIKVPVAPGPWQTDILTRYCPRR